MAYFLASLLQRVFFLPFPNLCSLREVGSRTDCGNFFPFSLKHWHVHYPPPGGGRNWNFRIPHLLSWWRHIRQNGLLSPESKIEIPEHHPLPLILGTRKIYEKFFAGISLLHVTWRVQSWASFCRFLNKFLPRASSCFFVLFVVSRLFLRLNVLGLCVWVT